MSKTPAIPTYRRHKISGQAVVTIRLPDGRRRDVYLGKYKSAESRREYARIVAELAAGATLGRAAGVELDHSLTVNEVCLRHLNHARQHYRRVDGKATGEVVEFLIIYGKEGILTRFYGHTLAARFGPLALKAVRGELVKSGLCRGVVNQRVNRIRRVFKWAASEELIPVVVHQALTTVQGLQAGRTEARETEPVGPVEDAVVDATLPHLNRHVRGMVEFQRLTGCRPGEVCLIRRQDIDTGGDVWLYKPVHHKLAYKGKAHVIVIGPKGQEVLREFLTPDLDAYLFSPTRAVEEFHAERSAKRVTPRWPSHMERNRRKRVRRPSKEAGEHFTSQSYGRAIVRACDAAFPPPTAIAQRSGETLEEWNNRLTEKQREDLAEWRRAHRWHPNQLRHSYATRIRKLHGLEAAQVLLGHSRADVTQVYTERNEELAVSVAAEVG